VRLNGHCSALVGERAVFSLFCSAMGLPVPRLLAVVDRRGGGRSATGRPLRGPADWRAFLADDVPPEIVVRPSARPGAAPRVLARDEIDADRLWEELAADPEIPAFIVEEHVHPLETVRVVTLVERSGAVRTLSEAPEQASDLARRAAPLLLPLRCLAWEIALTADGPVIVDAAA
jgi:hypothetical protein